MRLIHVLLPMLLSVAVSGYCSDCASVLQVKSQERDGKEHFVARNTSGKPIVAYVVVDPERDENGKPRHTFSGVFTAPDWLRPGKSMDIGSVPSMFHKPAILVDYVRTADGWSCGSAATNEAKHIIARFGN